VSARVANYEIKEFLKQDNKQNELQVELENTLARAERAVRADVTRARASVCHEQRNERCAESGEKHTEGNENRRDQGQQAEKGNGKKRGREHKGGMRAKRKSYRNKHVGVRKRVWLGVKRANEEEK